jgi:hypothetical protein
MRILVLDEFTVNLKPDTIEMENGHKVSTSNLLAIPQSDDRPHRTIIATDAVIDDLV